MFCLKYTWCRILRWNYISFYFVIFFGQSPSLCAHSSFLHSSFLQVLSLSFFSFFWGGVCEWCGLPELCGASPWIVTLSHSSELEKKPIEVTEHRPGVQGALAFHMSRGSRHNGISNCQPQNEPRCSERRREIPVGRTQGYHSTSDRAEKMNSLTWKTELLLL